MSRFWCDSDCATKKRIHFRPQNTIFLVNNHQTVNSLAPLLPYAYHMHGLTGCSGTHRSYGQVTQGPPLNTAKFLSPKNSTYF